MFPLAARPISPSWILDEVIDIRSDEFPHLFEGFMWASALLCALLCLLMSLRCGLGKTATIAWSVASFLLGPAGITVMLALNDWPAREACPACGRNRIVWRRQCSHCGSPEAPSAMDGREIFEPTDALPPDNGLLAAT
jgi:ribosomal protein L37E